MKLIKAFIHHVRTADVRRALGGCRLSQHHSARRARQCSSRYTKASRNIRATLLALVISEVRLSLVVEDDQVDDVTHLIRTVARSALHFRLGLCQRRREGAAHRRRWPAARRNVDDPVRATALRPRRTSCRGGIDRRRKPPRRAASKRSPAKQLLLLGASRSPVDLT